MSKIQIFQKDANDKMMEIMISKGATKTELPNTNGKPSSIIKFPPGMDFEWLLTFFNTYEVIQDPDNPDVKAMEMNFIDLTKLV